MPVGLLDLISAFKAGQAVLNKGIAHRSLTNYVKPEISIQFRVLLAGSLHHIPQLPKWIDFSCTSLQIFCEALTLQKKEEN